MKNYKGIFLTLLLSAVIVPSAFSHCQIPCGIYGDDNVFGELMMDVETIEKSMKQIQSLGEDPSKNPNQLIRWVMNKEDHANNIITVMSEYFLAQRIQLATAESNPETYNKLVGHIHQITVLAMKCKQTTDLNNASQLGKVLHDFQHLYADSR